ncbi:MAG: glycosyltransferase [Candidatus Omnitrophica bacterium]|nr:glycosyltransferase [Candidatus Omnitrophota bacterium]
MKIIYFIDSLGCGGTERQLILLVRKLIERGHEVELCCLKDQPGKNQGELDFTVNLFKIDKLMSFKTIRRIVRIVQYLKRIKPDVVHTYFIDATVVGILCAYLSGVPVRISSRRDLGFWYNTKTKFLMKLANMLSHGVLANSEAVKQSVIKNEKITTDFISVIHNGLDAALNIKDICINNQRIRHNLKIAEGIPVVGIVSNFNRVVKRVDLFIQAAKRVYELKRDLVFLVVGDGYQRECLQEMAREGKFGDKMQFLGLVDDVLPVMCVFDIAVNTSDTEGLSNAVLEYMACKCAVIVTNNPGNMEIIKDRENGLLAERGNADSIADAIISLLDDEKLRTDLTDKAFNYVKKEFLLDAMVSKHEIYYERFLKEA